MNCRHHWQPHADQHGIWAVCVKCGAEQQKEPHWLNTARNIQWLFDHRANASQTDPENITPEAD